jgi:hypothetical protein
MSTVPEPLPPDLRPPDTEGLGYTGDACHRGRHHDCPGFWPADPEVTGRWGRGTRCSCPCHAAAVSVRVELDAARLAEVARLDAAYQRPAEGVVWVGRVELRGEPAALRELAGRLHQAARAAEPKPTRPRPAP